MVITNKRIVIEETKVYPIPIPEGGIAGVITQIINAFNF